MSLWTEFFRSLSQPEYVHILLNPLPVYGLAAGLFALLVAALARSRPGQSLALVLILLGAVSAWPVMKYGHAGYDRVYSMSNDTAQKWLNWHMHLGETLVWIDAAAAALAAIALLATWRFERFRRLAVVLTAIVALAGLGFGGFVGFVGGKIRHSEFRSGPPPAWANTKSDDDED
ncbi:MAG TPA: hypothetical protein VG710_04880 [Opitutus sp.]|nr:hypothetical protein [Opitutus sp.]